MLLTLSAGGYTLYQSRRKGREKEMEQWSQQLQLESADIMLNERGSHLYASRRRQASQLGEL
jgi:hypothetical protein